MELRLLSADVDDLVDPDDAAIQKALAELPAISGKNPPPGGPGPRQRQGFHPVFCCVWERNHHWPTNRVLPSSILRIS